MKGRETIELTPAELETIKDEAGFRMMVTLSLKELKGLPRRVDKLETVTKLIIAIGTIVFIAYCGVAMA